MKSTKYLQLNGTGYDSIVRLLLDNKADINAVNFYNNSSLILASGGNHSKVI